MNVVDRRFFLSELALASGASLALGGTGAAGQVAPPADRAWPDWVPLQDPAVVKEVVTVAHTDVKRVAELVERQPALANATIDWGFGDWESALGAASHVGRRQIAEVLLAHGARPSIFSAAMLGQVDVVKAFVSASPGIQRTLGPHGITLMAHARAGGAGAVEVVKYLESVGDADRRPTSEGLDAADRDGLVGEYVFGSSDRDHFVIDVRNDQLGIGRPGQTRRFLIHTGGLVFFPSGVPSVRIAFARVGARATQLTIADPEVFLTATRRG
jgi:hypothetical protein